MGHADPDTLDTLIGLPGGIGELHLRSANDLAAAGLSATTIERLQSKQPDVAAVETWLQAPRHTLITWGSSAYPPLLARIPDPPPLLYGLGDPDLLTLPLIAVVGSRRPTPGGLETTAALTNDLCNSGLGIVSGLALGVDTRAHATALQGKAATVAVLGTGIDRVYPAANQDLATRIAGSGCIVSEFPLGSEARREHFPQRNRIISGLALGTLVVEAALRSGSLITARLAAEQGRDVFAVPGSIRNPMARGCHRLIRDGARLVETASDVISDIGIMVETLRESLAVAAAPNQSDINPSHQQLLDAMGYEPCAIDTLAERAALTIAEVSSMLLIMELEGRVESLPGGRFARLQ